MNDHRAREQMLALGREIPGIWAAYEEVRAESDQREASIGLTPRCTRR